MSFQFLALCQVLYILYEQCSTDSSNRLSVTTMKNIRKNKATYVLRYTFLIFLKALSFSSYSLLKNIVPLSNIS